MAERPQQPELTFGRIACTIPVSDLPRSLAFYLEVLGMEATFTNGDPMAFAIVEREGAELHLAAAPGHRGGGNNVAHLMVSNARLLHDHLVANGVHILRGLRDADYGLRGFVFEDPDGNRIDVGEEL